MNLNLFKEITEVTENRFAKSPLGKMAEGKTFDKPMSEYDKPLPLLIGRLKNCPIEGNNGHWEGEQGNSKWVPDRNYIPPGKKGDPPYNNPGKLDWGAIMDKHDIDGISYRDGEPDFHAVSKSNVEINGFSANKDDNFDKADIELAKQKGCTPGEVAKWRKENGYTWHECKDMKTCQKVPHEIHANVTHSGGRAEARKGNGDSA